MNKKCMCCCRVFLCLMHVVFSPILAEIGSACGAVVDVVDDGLVHKIDRHVLCLLQAPCTHVVLPDVDLNDLEIEGCSGPVERDYALYSLKKTWDCIKAQRKFDTQTLQRFGLLLFLVYESVIFSLEHDTRFFVRSVSWLTVAALYIRLSMIPLPKLFDILEECWEHYSYIIENFSLDGDFSLVAWLQEYWWVPVTAFVFFSVSFVRWYRARKLHHA